MNKAAGTSTRWGEDATDKVGQRIDRQHCNIAAAAVSMSHCVMSRTGVRGGTATQGKIM